MNFNRQNSFEKQTILNRSTPNHNKKKNQETKTNLVKSSSNNVEIQNLQNVSRNGIVYDREGQNNNNRNGGILISHDQQDSNHIMHNAQIRMLMEDYNHKFNPQPSKLRVNLNAPFLSRSQSSIRSSAGATFNSQSLYAMTDSKAMTESKGEDIMYNNNNNNNNTEGSNEDIQDQNLIRQDDNRNKQDDKQQMNAIHLPTISEKLIARMSEEVQKFNQGIRQQAKDQLYQAQKAFTSSTMPTESTQCKTKTTIPNELNLYRIKQTGIGNRSQTKSALQRSYSEKRIHIDNSDLLDAEQTTNLELTKSEVKQYSSPSNAISSPQQLKKSSTSKKLLNKPKSLVFIQNLSEYAQQLWTQALHQRVQKQEYQKASKELRKRGQQLIQLFESFIVEEIEQCSSEDIAMGNSLVLNEVCKIMQDYMFYSNSLLQKVQDNRKQNEEEEVIQLYAYSMKFHNPEHSDEFIQELKSFFLRNYETLFKKLRTHGNSSTQTFLDTLGNVEVFFKLYKDKLTITQQRVDSLQQEIEEMKRLIDELEQKQKNSHLVSERTEIEYKMKNREDILEVENRYSLLYKKRIEDSKDQCKKQEKEIESLKDIIQSRDNTILNQNQFIQSQKDLLHKSMADASTQIEMHIMPLIPLSTTNNYQLIQSNQQNNNIQSNSLQQNTLQTQSQNGQLNQSQNGQSNNNNQLSMFANDVMSPFTFSKQCSGAFVSLILTENLIHDYSLFHRHRFSYSSPSNIENHLINFAHHFFITKFANKLIGQIFFKNFLQSLQEYSSSGILRFTIFCQLAGFQVTQNQQSSPKNSNQKNLNKSSLSANSLNSQYNLQTFNQFIRKIFWESKQSYILYARTALLFKKIILSNNNNNDKEINLNGMYSLFENTELQNRAGQTEGYENGSILISKAQSIIQDIVSDHLPKGELIFEVYKSFQKYITDASQKREVQMNTVNEEENKANLSPTLKNKSSLQKQKKGSQGKSSVNKRVTMDEISMFIIDYLSELKSLQVEQFIVSVKCSQSENRNTNISLKEFSDCFSKHFAYSPFISSSPSFIETLFCKFFINITTTLHGGEEQKKQAIRPFLIALFDEFNEQNNDNISFYLSPEYLSTQSSQNIDRIASSPQKHQHQHQQISRILTSQNSRMNKSQDSKRQTRKQDYQNTIGVRLLNQNQNQNQNNSQALTYEQQMIQILHLELFDIPNSIILILETYEILKPLIKNQEALDNRIKLDHEKLKSILPSITQIKKQLKPSTQTNQSISTTSPPKPFIESVKYVQQSLNNVILYATSKLNLPINF